MDKLPWKEDITTRHLSDKSPVTLQIYYDSIMCKKARDMETAVEEAVQLNMMEQSN